MACGGCSGAAGRGCQVTRTFGRRKRTGSADVFDKRYQPIPRPDGSLLRDWNDPEILAADIRYVWSVTDCDGRLYVTPGYAVVNYFGRLLCAVPWPDVEMENPDYRYA
jgi:hypothetical protein